jgi:hypothetical protein
MPGPWRGYTEAERASAVGLALTVGAKRAAEQTGIPRRTLSSWLHRKSPEVEAAIVRTRDDVAARLWEAVTTGTDAVLAGLRDPKARIGDKASALRIVVEAHALISRGATSRTETVRSEDWFAGMTEDERHEVAVFLRKMIDAPDQELMAYFASDPTWGKHFGRWKVLPEEDATDVG